MGVSYHRTLGYMPLNRGIVYTRSLPLELAGRVMKYGTMLLLTLTLSIAAQAQTPEPFWEQTSGPEGATVHALVVNETGGLFAGTDQGAFRSVDDGQTWVLLDNGLPTVSVLSFAINAEGGMFAGTDGEGIFRSVDDGQTWTGVGAGSGAPPSAATMAINAEGDIFAGWGELYRSEDNGATWANLDLYSRIPPYPTDELPFVVLEITINTNDEIFLWTPGGPFRSGDKGETWTDISEGVGGFTFSITIDADGDIFAGTCAEGLFRSGDNGETWVGINEGLPVDSLTLTRNVIDLAISAGGDLFASVGTGGGWCSSTTNHGVYRSTDDGATWAAVNTGLTNLFVQSLAIGADGRLFAGTAGDGVFRSVESTSPVAVETIYGDVPRQFSLSQNYPNPFNPSTTIAFTVPQSGPVRLQVYDLLGKLVATLVDSPLAAGRYQTTWEATGLASGVYLYRLEAEGWAQTKKLTLLR